MSPLSSLTKEQIRDRIRGALIGNAVGDAYGLATEFMLKRTAVELYGNGPIAFGLEPGYPVWEDSHRSISERNDFTDDTDQLLLMLQSLEQTADGTLHALNFAKKMAEWNDFGFPELGTPARGIGYTVGQVLDHQEFRTNPHKAAFDIWNVAGRNLAPNGAVMRTAPVGVESFWDEPRVVRNALAAAKITHADPRSIVAALVSAVLISRLLRGGGQDPDADKDRIWNPKLSSYDNEATIQYKGELLEYLRRGSDFDGARTRSPEYEAETPDKKFKHKDFRSLEATRLAHEAAHPPNRPEPHNVVEWNKNRPTAVPRPHIGWAGIDAVGEDTATGALARQVLDDYKFLLLETDVVPLPRGPHQSQSYQQRWTEELLSSCFPQNMHQLELGSASAMGYAYKCIGIAYYGATRKVDPSPDPAQPEYRGPSGLFRGLMEQVTLEGGDADTNAAVMGSLLGARFGLEEGVPTGWWRGLQHLDWLNKTIDRFLDRVMRQFEEAEKTAES
ncbi:hypothetical protein BGZ52_006300 [Haplosporangium bisporale]|nr:hypothetical protein BGZ52_006300 [Haplosporangium bisporale]KAF9215584.1 hypothetical protein BGZ59_000918 [Podila verticillata]KAI9234188.1 MAG: ADP-ribosylglycohydrolase-domain-containing protein [Podila humilis]KFH68091.1 hypothetical protein MVEG_06821 [Podila verticillata NRRL 6337]